MATVLCAVLPKYYPEFLTVTCLNWKFVLAQDNAKDILVTSMDYLVRQERVIIFGFVIMSNHFHLIWQMNGDNEAPTVQRDFLKYTSQQLLKMLSVENSSLHSKLRVNAKDREYQVWERRSLRISLWTDKVFDQKLEYIHMNPVRAGLCRYPEDYKYSSAGFYLMNSSDWKFLSHADG